MPAQIVIVHDDRLLADEGASALRSAGHTVAVFTDPIAGLNALETAKTVELLITRVDFGPRKLNGIALANMVHYKRGRIPVLFAALPENQEFIDEQSHFHFVALPIQPDELVLAVEATLRHGAEEGSA